MRILMPCGAVVRLKAGAAVAPDSNPRHFHFFIYSNIWSWHFCGCVCLIAWAGCCMTMFAALIYTCRIGFVCFFLPSFKSVSWKAMRRRHVDGNVVWIYALGYRRPSANVDLEALWLYLWLFGAVRVVVFLFFTLSPMFDFFFVVLKSVLVCKIEND